MVEPPVAPRWVAVAVGSSVGGQVVHNLAEFPPAILTAPETLVPVAVSVLLGVALFRWPGTTSSLLTAGWAVLVIVGGGASVLPLGVLPFTPAQTAGHYAAHVVYAVAQVPLLWVAVQGLGRTRPETRRVGDRI